MNSGKFEFDLTTETRKNVSQHSMIVVLSVSVVESAPRLTSLEFVYLLYV